MLRIGLATGMHGLEASDVCGASQPSAASQIEELRNQAHGRFLSASYPGLFDKDRAAQAAAVGPFP